MTFLKIKLAESFKGIVLKTSAHQRRVKIEKEKPVPPPELKVVKPEPTETK